MGYTAAKGEKHENKYVLLLLFLQHGLAALGWFQDITYIFESAIRTVRIRRAFWHIGNADFYFSIIINNQMKEV